MAWERRSSQPELSATLGRVPELLCGLSVGGRRCAPAWLQPLASRAALAALLAAHALLHRAAHGLLAANEHQLRLRLGLSHAAVDWLLSAADLGQALLVVPLSRVGGGVRPQWVGALSVLQALACTLLALAHTTHWSEGTTDDDSTGAADGTRSFIDTQLGAGDGLNETLCGVAAPARPAPCYVSIALLALLQLARALAGASALVHGVVYLDDNVVCEAAPALIGVVLALQQLGFRLGHVLAYLTSGGAEDPVNGWWIGWSVLAGLLGVVGVLLVMFPPRLPAAAVRDAVGHILREAKATVAPADGARVHISTRRYVIREPPDTALCPSLARVFTNRVAMLKMIAVLFGIVAFGCMETFKDKYLESIYHIPLPKDLLQDVWLSRITTNLLEPVVSALCVLCSGLVISWRRPRARPLAAWMAAAGAGCALLTLGQVWLGCHQLSVSGEREGQLADFQRTCNAACGCSRDQDFAPVCGVTSRQTYYSPCLAGCTEVGSNTGLLRGCSCVPGGGLAQSGSCGADACASRWVTLQALWMGAAVLRSTAYVASVIMVLRCLEPEDKSLGLGCLNAVVGLLALLPAYFAFRVVTDSSCEFWDDAQYSCKLYHSRRLELTVTLFLVVLLLCSSVLDACVGLFARRVRIYPDTEADEGDDGGGAGGGGGGGGGVAELSADQRQKLLRRRATPLPRRRRDAPEVQLRRREGEDGGPASSDEQDVGDGDGACEDDEEQELRAVQRLMARSNGRVQPGLATTAF